MRATGFAPDGDASFLALAASFAAPMSEELEAKLVERLARREEAAFNEVVRLYQKKVFRLLQRMLGDPQEAEDVAQDVFITVLKRADTFRGESRFSTWLYRIAVNHGKNRLKYLGRRARGKQDELSERSEHDLVESASMATSAHIDRPDAIVEGFQMERLLRQALETLDPDQRELVVLRDAEHLSYEEIQQITGLPEGTVKSRLHRAREKLKEHIERAMRIRERKP